MGLPTKMAMKQARELQEVYESLDPIQKALLDTAEMEIREKLLNLPSLDNVSVVVSKLLYVHNREINSPLLVNWDIRYSNSDKLINDEYIITVGGKVI